MAIDNQLKIYFAVINDFVSGSELISRMIALLMNKEFERISRKAISPNFDVLYRNLHWGGGGGGQREQHRYGAIISWTFDRR